MSWLGFGKTKSNLPAATHLQEQRSKQIGSLKQFNRNVTEIQRDVEYRVTMTIGSSTVSLNITLPPSFPQEKPVVKVSPAVRHPWVNEHMIVTGCPSINSFGVHTDLGRTICSVVLEFTNNPPMIFGTEHPQCTPPSQLPYTPQPQAAAPFVAPYPVNPISTVPSGMNYIPQIPMPTLTTSSPVPMSCSYTMPTVPTSFPDLHSKTVSQLQAFNAEEHILAEYSLNLPQMKKLQVDRLDLCNANEDLAKINLRKKPYLESQKEELRQKYEILEQLRKQFDIDCQKQQTLSERYNPSNLLTHLKIASAEAEEESEKIADLFLDKQIDIESFVQQFMEKRKLCHTRKGKEEKLMQLADRRY